MESNRIHPLDNILANQIAAGEVVERPASVVKELLENAIDAGASRIDIEVEKGGAGLIRVKDDGSGIHPEDLTLALSRHATSKIKATEDLAAISSLGFRGEALASISSVSKLDLISKWQHSDQALKAEAHGRDMEVSVTPAGLNQGTLVEVRELFFNTPARRRFMRTDKTEFRNIDTVVTRIALSHPKINFMLKHNGKKIRQFIAAENRQSEELRVGQILGKDFMKNCVHFSLQHQIESDTLKFSGWLGLPEHNRSMNDGQFVYINNRAVKDKVVSHAIREAYADLIPKGRLPAYIIKIEMDAETVDVNVHPTKHEVRFQHQRMVHDLIIRAIAEVLSEANKELPTVNNTSSTSVTLTSNSFSGDYYQNKYIRENTGSTNEIAESAEIYGEFVNSSYNKEQQSSLLVNNQFLILPYKEKLLLISLELYVLNHWHELWSKNITGDFLDISPVLFPVSFSLTSEDVDFLNKEKYQLDNLGLKFFIDEKNNTAKILSVPIFMAGIHTNIICNAILKNSKSHKFIASFLKDLSKEKTVWQSIIDYHHLQSVDAILSWINQQVELTALDLINNDLSWICEITSDSLQKLFKNSSQNS